MNPTGPYILVGAGGKFYFREPEKFNYDIRHIAGALSRLCRFTGHTSQFYSVAQHSAFCADWLLRTNRPQFALEALLHDAPEAFIADLSSPLKSLLPEYKALEAPIQRAIYDAFGVTVRPEDVVSGGKSRAVHEADMVALATEKRDLMPFDPEPWPCLNGIDPARLPLIPLNPLDAEELFLQMFVELTDEQPTHHLN